MRGVNVGMVAVLVLGLFGITVAAGPPLRAVPDGRDVSGGKAVLPCYTTTFPNCEQGTRKCGTTECKQSNQDPTTVVCPKDAVTDTSAPFYREAILSGGGNKQKQDVGMMHCIKTFVCASAGSHCSEPDANRKRFCTGIAGSDVPSDQSGPHAESIHTGEPCP